MGKDKLAWLARAGYMARAAVYLIVGAMAMLASLGEAGGHTTGGTGALASLLQAPLGRVLLVVLAAGLAGFCLWRLAQSLLDADYRGRDLKGIVTRIAYAGAAGIYAFFAWYAVALAFGRGAVGDQTGDRGAHEWSAWLLREPGGQWWLGIIGIGIAAAGVSQIVKAWRETYRRYLALDWRKLRWANPVCKFGLIARGVVFLMVGMFVVLAAVHYQPDEARGVGGALHSLLTHAYGHLLLAIVSLGLVSFGGFSLIQAFYRQIHVPDPTR